MSLINEALKKAQQSRPQPGSDTNRFGGGFASSSVSMHRDLRVFRWIFGIVLMSSVLVTLLLMLVTFSRKEPASDNAPEKVEEIAVTVVRPAPTTPTADALPAEPALPQPAPILLNLQPPEPPPIVIRGFEPEEPPAPAIPPETTFVPPAETSLPSSVPTAEAVVIPSPAESASPAQADASTPDPATAISTAATVSSQVVTIDGDAPPPPPPPSDPAAIRAFLEESRISGIRMAGNDSRVLLNNRVYSIGSTVSHALGLSIEVIQPNEITFVDAAGNRYRKSFP